MRNSFAMAIIALVVVAGVATQGTTAAPAAGSSPAAPAATGGWVPIGDIGNNFYQQVANFALVMRMLVLRTEELTLVEVVAGSVQPAGAGNNYRLLMRAAEGGDGGVVGRYEAVVWGVPRSTAWTWKVLSFKRVAGN